MSEPDDQQLLREFAETNSETAFATLVARHVNLVYSTALRFSGNPHRAEEITQVVFALLARKGGSLGSNVILSGWLYQTARLTAASVVKSEVSRQRREQEAYMQSSLNERDPAAWEQIAPLLDAAMGRLGETDRNAVVLHFFEKKTVREVAATLQLTEAAAHKRVHRALEKLRQFFLQRGVDSSTAAIGETISAHSVQAAPTALAKAATAIALAKGGAAATSTLTLITGALKIMAWTKTKTAIVTGVIVLFAATSTVVIGIRASRAHHPVAEPSTGLSPISQRMIADLQPDGSILFQGTVEETNNTSQTITTDRMNDGDSTWRYTEKSGRPLKISKLGKQPRSGVLVTLTRAVRPGETSAYVVEGKMDGIAHKNDMGEYEVRDNSHPGNVAEVHVMEVWRLPAGAMLVEKGDGLSAATNSDRIELTFDRMIPPNGSYFIGFRYRLATAIN
jgi:RNA polymerase sigma factor (sigma-70 family)